MSKQICLRMCNIRGDDMTQLQQRLLPTPKKFIYCNKYVNAEKSSSVIQFRLLGESILFFKLIA